eukprot:5130985-Amphidinium_carterae.1
MNQHQHVGTTMILEFKAGMFSSQINRLEPHQALQPMDHPQVFNMAAADNQMGSDLPPDSLQYSDLSSYIQPSYLPS